MNRRRVLAALGSTLPLAGCLAGRSDHSDVTATTNPTTNATPTNEAGTTPKTTPESALAIGDVFQTADGREITVVDVHLRRSVFDLFVPDAVQPLVGARSQFVFLTLPIEDPETVVPDPRSFSLVFDDERYAGSGRVGGVPIDDQLSIPNDDVHPTPARAVEVGHSLATVGFEIPLYPQTDSAVIVWDDGEETARWAWDDDLVEVLDQPPEFEVVAVDAADSFTCGESFGASITVENHGGRDGVFNAVVPIVGPVYEEHPPSISLTVPAEGRATWDGSLQYPPQLRPGDCDDVDNATFKLDWGMGSRTLTVEQDE